MDGSERRFAPNGLISTKLRLSCAIRYFAGAAVYDLVLTHGMGRSTIYSSIWGIVDVVNQCDALGFNEDNAPFPSIAEQEEIAAGFHQRSEVGFDNVIGAIDAMIVTIDLPDRTSCKEVGVGQKSFHCSRKDKYGLVLLAICDDQCRIRWADITQPGKASDYQGWDLVQNKGIYKIGIPTLSGTGAEATRTCVMTNPESGVKLGMNSDFSVFDEVILDPVLTVTVPREQYFFSGMDAYVHCIKSLAGRYRHPVGDTYSQSVVSICKEVFTHDEMMSEENRSKLMVASYLGGSAIGMTMVGLVHPFSAGLSVVLGTRHCISNCIVMQAMEQFYPDAFQVFMTMVEKQEIDITISPEDLTMGALLTHIRKGSILKAHSIMHGFAELLEIEVRDNLDSKILGKNIEQINIPNNTILCCIIRNNDFIFNTSNILLEQNDRLVCLVSKKDVKQIEDLFE